MPTTMMIHGSDGEVMAPIMENSMMIRGKHVNITVIAISPDEEVPEEIRRALVGLRIDTVFSSKQLQTHMKSGAEGTIPDTCRIAYATTVIQALHKAGKATEAEALERILPNELDLYIFEPGTFR